MVLDIRLLIKLIYMLRIQIKQSINILLKNIKKLVLYEDQKTLIEY